MNIDFMGEINFLLQEAESLMQEISSFMLTEFGKIHAGKVSPDILSSIKVLYYDNMCPLNQVAVVNVLDARTLILKPFDEKMLKNIEVAIRKENGGFSVQNDGHVLKIILPQLTEERRKILTKDVRDIAERHRVRVRNVRKDIKDRFKDLKKNGVSEDEIKKADDGLQKLTDKYVKLVDEVTNKKEKDLMTL
ncbi:MAG: ribosome recycling factor [Cytophagales bacterium]|jgi:ribosome recycling factor|nr:ribosome recycling factor [Cytophagales bacterium]